ncbi:MAG: hypothetical protein A2Y38_04135 [Spirochaetes bacterium GWB1_59_5]|nr:MAG: hypothetical protein A2Y38_04135 [Spirochaetes bacterium GWB1_59_5]
MRAILWFEPLVTEKGADGKRVASKGSIILWIVLINDLSVIWYIITHAGNISHIELALGFLEILTVTIFGYVFAGKTVLNKNKYGVFGNGGNGNGGNGGEAKPDKSADV